MSIKANIHFFRGDERVATLYQHHDGDPDSMGARFEAFFDSIERVTDDHRYDDPRYLSAKFVIWHALGAAERSGNDPLSTLGIAVDNTHATPADYDYFVLCTGRRIGDPISDPGRPTVRVQAVDRSGRPVGEPQPIHV